jgi:hypothetical protein
LEVASTNKAQKNKRKTKKNIEESTWSGMRRKSNRTSAVQTQHRQAILIRSLSGSEAYPVDIVTGERNWISYFTTDILSWHLKATHR